jgi:hypothetical protein
MTGVRPLKDVFADLLGGDGGGRPDPGAALAAGGHPDLPPELVAEAVVSYADTAPVEVAEHLAPYVTQASGVPTVDPDSAAPEPDLRTLGDLLASAPTGPDVDLAEPPGYELDDLDPGTFAGIVPPLGQLDDPAALDFGGGASEPGAAGQPGALAPEPDGDVVEESRPDELAALPTDPDVGDAPPLELTLPRPERVDDDGAGDSAGLDHDDPAAGLDA